MKIDLNEFRNVLAKLKIVVKPSLKFDLGGYLFVLKDKFQTYNNNSSVIYAHDNSSLEDEFAVEFEALNKFCKVGKGKEIEFTTDENTMIAKIGSSKLVLAKSIGMFDKFKSVNFEDDGYDYEPLPEDFLNGLTIAKEFVGNNEQKAQTMFVKVEDDTIESTNNFVICRYWMLNNMGKMFIKYDKIDAIISISPTMYKKDGSKIIFKNGDCSYIMAQINTNFYNFDNVLGGFDDLETVTFGEDVIDKVECANIATGKNKESGIYIAMDNDKATFVSSNDVMSTSAETTLENFTGNLKIKGRADFFKYLFACNNEVKFAGTTKAYAENDDYCIVIALMKDSD